MSRKIRIKARIQEFIQEFIETHKLGEKIARQKLGLTPRFVVIEQIEAVEKLGRTGTFLAKVKFNSDQGAFKGAMAIKEFSTKEEAQRLVDINQWLFDRVQNIQGVSVPQILSAGDKYIIYEGVDGESFDESRINPEIKYRLAGKAISAYHGAIGAKVNDMRYYGLLNNMIELLPITQDRKDKLFSFGLAYLSYYNKDLPAIYSYGDFHPGNIIISHEGTHSYLIDPEFVETTAEADRFEDISNFIVFDMFREFIMNEALTDTFKYLNILIEAYDEHLKYYSTNIESLYKGTQWIALFFHLGLIALIKGGVALQSISTADRAQQQDVEELIQSYRFCRYLWLMGVSYLPINAFPPGITPNTTTEDGWLITWPILGKLMLQVVRSDYYFRILFSFSSTRFKMSIDELIEKHKLKDKKELQNIIKQINMWINFDVIAVDKEDIKVDPQWRMKLGLLLKFHENWELSSKLLYGIWRKNPVNILLVHLNKYRSALIEDLDSLFPEKNQVKDVLKEAESHNLIEKTKKTVVIKEDWKEQYGLPHYFDFNFFEL